MFPTDSEMPKILFSSDITSTSISLWPDFNLELVSKKLFEFLFFTLNSIKLAIYLTSKRQSNALDFRCLSKNMIASLTSITPVFYESNALTIIM